jgi:ribonuclease BN (tRNA processing enzyme)
MTLELTFLGTGNAFGSAPGRYWSSFLANGRYVFDAPPTVLPHLKRLGTPLTDIEVVFISHFHGDHFMGLPFLFLEYVYLTERRDDLFIVGPPGVEEKTEEFSRQCYAEVTRDVGYRRRYVEARPGSDQYVNEIGFQAFPMNHVAGKLECFGYRVPIGGKTVAYTGDTMLCDEVFELAEGADVMVTDCTYTEGNGPEHMSVDDLRVIRKRVAPETTIVLTHLGGEPDVTGLENVVIARDFGTYRFD